MCRQILQLPKIVCLFESLGDRFDYNNSTFQVAIEQNLLWWIKQRRDSVSRLNMEL